MTPTSMETLPEKVWVASAWFEGADPFMTLAFDPRRFTKRGAQRKFIAEWRKNVQDLWRGANWGQTKEEFFDSADHWSGLSLESTELFVRTEEQKDGLLKYGWTYV